MLGVGEKANHCDIYIFLQWLDIEPQKQISLFHPFPRQDLPHTFIMDILTMWISIPR